MKRPVYPQAIQDAADLLHQARLDNVAIPELPLECRPKTLADGYAIQACVAAQSGRQVAGWKVAAIFKDCPMAGRILSEQIVASGVGFPVSGNRIRKAEPEFAFRMGRDLPPRADLYTVDDVLAAVAALHPAIEIPNARYRDFTRMDAPQLAADSAYSEWLVTAPAAAIPWHGLDLTAHPVTLWLNGARIPDARENVLGSPLLSLTWLAQELHLYGCYLRAGDMVTTGGCTPLIDIAAGDTVRADFGVLGAVEASFY